MVDVNPYASPQSYHDLPTLPLVQESAGLWRDGDVLVMLKDANLPDICIKSNEPCAGPRLKRTLYWHSPLIFLAIIASIWIYIILALLLRKKAVIWIPLSPQWWARRRRNMIIGTVSALVSVVLFIGGIMLMATAGPRGGTQSEFGLFALVSGIIGFLFGAIFGSMGSRMIVAKKIDDKYAWIKGVNSAYLDTLPVFENTY